MSLSKKLLKSNLEFKNLTKIKNEFKIFTPNIIQKFKIKQDNSGVNFNKNVFYSRFTPTFIVNEIQNNFNYLNYFEAKYKTNILQIYYYNDSPKINFYDLQLKIIKIFSVMEYFNINNKKIVYNLALTKFEKKINNQELEIGPDTVNSGFTSFYLNSDPIISIFRKEESDRLVIHELIHCLRLDFENFSKINDVILKEMNIFQDAKYINFFEAYTDSVAIIFNSVLNSILCFKDLNNVFYTELKYVEDTALLILNHFNLKDINQLFKKQKKNKIYQKTSVLSYYLLKLGLLSDVDNFLRINLKKKIDVNRALKLYYFSKNNLLTKKFKFNNLNKKSLKMSYNEIDTAIF